MSTSCENDFDWEILLNRQMGFIHVSLQGAIVQATSGRDFASSERVLIARRMLSLQLEYKKKESELKYHANTRALEREAEEIGRILVQMDRGNYEDAKKYINLNAGKLADVMEKGEGFKRDTFISALATRARNRPAFRDYQYGLREFSRNLPRRVFHQSLSSVLTSSVVFNNRTGV